MTLRDDYKLTWLALAEDHAALSRSLEQLMALPRSVKVKRVLLVSLAAKFLSEAFSVRAIANAFQWYSRIITPQEEKEFP